MEETKMRKLMAFKASWCAPCKMLTPVLKELQAEGYEIEMIDVDEQAELADANSVKSIPTLDFFEDGAKYRRVLGYQNKEQLIEYFTEKA
jgi:thioredoxin 1